MLKKKDLVPLVRPLEGMPHDRSRQVHGLVRQVILDINGEFGVLKGIISGVGVMSLPENVTFVPTISGPGNVSPARVTLRFMTLSQIRL